MIIEPEPQARSLTQLARGRLPGYRGFRDIASPDEEWVEGVHAATQAAQEDLLISNTRLIGSGQGAYDASRMSTVRQLRMLREMRARGIGVRGGEGVRSEIRALGRGELLRPGGPGAADMGALLDAAEPCPILSDEWHLLDDVPGPDAALLDLDLRSDGHQVAPEERPPLLRPGMCFQGSQCNNRITDSSHNWSVAVRVEECDWIAGYICGSMTADNVPKVDTPVTTFWEGSIVGVGPHTFVTGQWGADKANDWSHWQKFPAFQRIQQHLTRAAPPEDGISSEEAQALASAAVVSEDVVFMRWKERSFDSKHTETCGLTIQGFYYVAMSCTDGQLEGYYFDSGCQPFQKLKLEPARMSHHGFSSSAYKFS